MKPKSYQDQDPDLVWGLVQLHGCFNCAYSAIPDFRSDMLCFFGENPIITEGHCPDRKHVEVAYGELFPCGRKVWRSVSSMDQSEYGRILGGRNVLPCGICDEWRRDAS